MRLPSLDRLSRSHSPVVGALLALLLGGCIAVSSAQAQGFGVYEQGTCVMARAGAAVANGCGDGSSIFFNPAEMAKTGGITVSLGATAIDATGEFTYDYTARAPYTGVEVDLENDPIPVPHLYGSYALNEDLGLGLGVYVPYGLETNWPVRLSDGSVFDGAFEGFENRVQSIYIQPTVSYQVTPKLRVGGGPVVAVSSVELNQVQDLSQTPVPEQFASQLPQAVLDQLPQNEPLTFGKLGVPFHTAFARTQLEATNQIGFGVNLGATYELSDRLRIGARFLSPITVEYEGDASFEQIDTGLAIPENSALGQQIPLSQLRRLDVLLNGQFEGDGLLSEQSVETEITFPMQIVGGVSFQATDRLLLLADYQFTGWSAFDEIPLDFENLGSQTREENYNNTHAVRIAAEYDVLDQLTARAGYLYNTPAAPDEVVTPLLPENDRNQYTIGVGYRPADIFEVNVSYQLLMQNDRRGRVRGALPGEDVTTDLNQGLYSFGANLFGATLTLHL
jgi:long-chain fatty acid transport protein